MKITSVDIFVLKPVGAEYCAFPFAPCVCKINTDEGICGYGEAGISIGIGANGVAHFTEDLASLLIGKDPMRNEQIWEDFRCRCSGHLSGGGVVVFSAMSALDTAMLDIKGKALGVPCYQLLGGKHRDTLSCYVSQVQTGWRERYGPIGSAEGYGEVCRRVMEEGFKAAKVNFITYDEDGHTIRKEHVTGPLSPQIRNMVIRRLKAIRKACGDDFGIIMENVCATDLTSAIQLAQIAEDYGVMLLEEPVFNFNPELIKVVSEKTKVPISSGEKLHTRWGAYQTLKQNAISLIQPEISNCGGLSEAKKICDLAHIFDVKVQAHVAGSPISEAAAMQLEAAIPNFFIHEFYSMAVLPECKEYCTNIYEPVNGELTVPDLPGLGQELSEKAMAEALQHIVVK